MGVIAFAPIVSCPKPHAGLIFDAGARIEPLSCSFCGNSRKVAPLKKWLERKPDR